jgi:single-strand DNA-binding protein
MKAEGKGTIIAINPTQQITDTFSKREFVVETSEENNGQSYSQSIKFQVMKDKCSMLDSFAVGDEVSVSFNITGKPYDKNGTILYFNNLNAWKITKLGEQAPAPTNTGTNDASDDLPF